MAPCELSQLLRSTDAEIMEARSRGSHLLLERREYSAALLNAADDSTSIESSTVPAWLKELLFSEDEDYASSLAQFIEDPDATTLALMDEMARIAGVIVANQWREDLGEEAVQMLRNGSGYWGFYVQPFASALQKLQDNSRWTLICRRANDFVIEASGSLTKENVFESIEALRKISLRRPAREVELQAEIRLLKECLDGKEQEIRQQRRIIEDLSFRHIMENLIDPAKWTGNYAADWRTFWDDAVSNAMPAGNRVSRKTNSPIVRLINQFGATSEGTMKGNGGAMYGTLSTNIHHYGGAMSSVYEIQSQRNKTEKEIMKAIAPLPSNIQNQRVNWTAERRRFL